MRSTFIALTLFLSIQVSAQVTNYTGSWKNVDDGSDGITELQIKRNDDSYVISAWGKCHPTDCEWGETPLRLVALSPGAKPSTDEAIATWTTHFSDIRLIVVRRDSKLIVTSYTEFTDKSGRDTYKMIYEFEKRDN
ncbi:hypothetical protein VITU102760_11095 [Vibrio tubiashii]|jgi:hypothetical protein|uniref:Lipocalin-like domain-containing protein n=1 Tax=Vibrio tubiashii ATCC 19109 TaxID=1051646 RepID=F9T1C4_9VIBR|nr:hypothetical protein [Vibrio tubiashii]AIW14045.1 hypothetical protein IX91_07495 [Vibrio tubiashii ATCC 19109]EGU58305.1 hypothetical protein VITU9109_19215 [Vibrio tubiashii ATCC 19109]EIF03173.1 hypothetical protein VT1337_14919 [Vibrio tubiashii NCIMB 1337 = ATCC 19106]